MSNQIMVFEQERNFHVSRLSDTSAAIRLYVSILVGLLAVIVSLIGAAIIVQNPFQGYFVGIGIALILILATYIRAKSSRLVKDVNDNVAVIAYISTIIDELAKSREPPSYEGFLKKWNDYQDVMYADSAEQSD